MRFVFILSGPSGAGKTTLWEKIKPEANNLGIEKVITSTTRKPRSGEVNGKDYRFVDIQEFKEKIKSGKMIEWAQVHGNFYGSTIDELERIINSGKYPLYIVDPQGVITLKNLLSKKYGFKIKTIFVIPPSEEELKIRLIKRGEDPNSESFKLRLEESLNWYKMKDSFDYVIINDDLEKAVLEFKNILKKYIVTKYGQSRYL